MPTCKQCDASFPNRLVIEGKQRNLGSRKYCLQCSPWGQHNTSALHKQQQPIKGDIYCCCDCGREFKFDTSKGHRRGICNSCNVKKRHVATKQKAVDYKGGACYVCNYSRCLRALCFHHVDEKHKTFGIGGNYNRAWSALRKELDKCVLLCHVCHDELHDGLIELGPLA